MTDCRYTALRYHFDRHMNISCAIQHLTRAGKKTQGRGKGPKIASRQAEASQASCFCLRSAEVPGRGGGWGMMGYCRTPSRS